MPALVTQQDLRKAQDLPFCYFCGRPFESRKDRTDDHVPPESIFAIEDRDTPLILHAHEKCNGERSVDDKIIGQLVAVAHEKHPEPRDDHLARRFKIYQPDDRAQPLLGIRDVPIESIIWRWVRGFHAALYENYLPEDTHKTIRTPFWRGFEKDHELVVKGPDPHETVLVDFLKKNRSAQTLDRIETCQHKCVYECTWDRLDNGGPICIFALRVYNWEMLGDSGLPRRGCFGAYLPSAGQPVLATRATRLEVLTRYKDLLDPFGE